MASVCRLYICVLCMFGVVFGDYDWSNNPGDGTEGNPYQISRARQLASIGSDATLLDKFFILTDDIDMSGYLFDNSPIAPDTDQDNVYTDENRFEGSIDGQGHRIYNLTITRSGTSYHIGLIGVATGSTWEVKNLGLKDVDISVGDSSQHIGGLVARGYGGTVSDCYVTGLISSGTNTVKMGGLMGFATSNISNCYVKECTVSNGTGSSSTGGAIGYLSAPSEWMEKCYSTGIVDSESSASSIGALVGTLYNASVNDCYFLITAGPDNGYGEPKSSSELKNIYMYTNAGWVFNGAEIGNDGHWRMRDGMLFYPYLAWEFMKGDFYGDFKVDLLDFAAFSQSWKSYAYSADFNWLCDLDKSGVIELSDFTAFCDDWLMADYDNQLTN